ncbi:hypothetical protein MtrunA17_Chr1g0176731 [Medicago truncatula]|uniref:Uncharacterized protein n=1 Tax=Medicago truncatula TaxID=3880 RepID=A0A396JRJ6_MEDTR|nr:hypothetical protein MtrunA17_Chr1g0176731 [Medicago truncatula]
MSINQGSCRGFILLYSNPKIYLWNTSTRVHRQIPSLPPNHSRLPSYGFGYDESTDDYLVVSVSYDYIPSSYDVISHLAIFHCELMCGRKLWILPVCLFMVGERKLLEIS